VSSPGDTQQRAFASLLDHLAVESLDSDYAAVAQRRSTATGRRPGVEKNALNRPIVVAVLAVFGVLVGVSALLTSKEAPVVDQQRAELVTALQQQQDKLDQEKASFDRLRAAVITLRQQNRTVAAQGSRVLAQSTALQVAAASTAVAGPGIIVTVDDAPGATSQASQGAIRDSDLQSLINGLWTAGAEAIAINGSRVGPGTAIRLAGEAITVNYRSLDAPYTVKAIGDPDTLPAALAETQGGQLMASLQRNLRVRFAVQTATRLTVPAGTGKHARYATADPGGD
jgi:uncharacterized protein YlxW (UPF0749 family)